MLDTYPSLIDTMFQKLSKTTRLDGDVVVFVSINKLAP